MFVSQHHKLIKITLANKKLHNGYNIWSIYQKEFLIKIILTLSGFERNIFFVPIDLICHSKLNCLTKIMSTILGKVSFDYESNFSKLQFNPLYLNQLTPQLV